MTKRHLLMLSTIGLLLCLTGLSGCFIQQGVMVNSDNITEPINVGKEMFLLKITEDNENVALYLRKPEQENIKIASNIDYFYYLKKSNALLLGEKTEELKYSLYLQTADGNQYFIGNTAVPQSITVSADEAVLYFLGNSNAAGKDSGVVYKYPIAGDYENNTGVPGTAMEKVVSDIISFAVLPEEGIVYVTAEDKLYIKKDGQESQLIAADIAPDIKAVANRIFYKTKDQGSLSFFEYNQAPRAIDSNISAYQVSDNGELVFYLNQKAELYCYNLKNNSKEMIDHWLNRFLIDNQGKMVIYKDMDENVYLKENGEKREKIGFGCRAWEAEAGAIVYLAYNQELTRYTYGQGQEELASGVKNFVLDSSGHSLAYYSIYDELFFQELGQERIKIADAVTDFVKIYLGNNLLYEQNMPSKSSEPITVEEEKDMAEEEIEECLHCTELPGTELPE